ncbi:MAG: hypothetical protein ACOVOQ_07835 [Flavobacterium sp.]
MSTYNSNFSGAIYGGNADGQVQMSASPVNAGYQASISYFQGFQSIKTETPRLHQNNP